MSPTMVFCRPHRPRVHLHLPEAPWLAAGAVGSSSPLPRLVLGRGWHCQAQAQQQEEATPSWDGCQWRHVGPRGFPGCWETALTHTLLAQHSVGVGVPRPWGWEAATGRCWSSPEFSLGHAGDCASEAYTEIPSLRLSHPGHVEHKRWGQWVFNL